MTNLVLEHDAKDIRIADGRRLTFHIPDASVLDATAPVADSRPPKHVRRRAAVAIAVTALVAAGSVAVPALLKVRDTIENQERELGQLLGRTASAEGSLDDLRQLNAEKATENASLTAAVNSLKEVAGTQLDVAAIAQKVRPSVITINTPRSLGSGFVVHSANGVSNIITSYHVVADVVKAGGQAVSVELRTGSVVGAIIRVSEDADLALVTVARTLPVLSKAAGDPAVGEPIMVAGSPRGLADSVTSGVVSALRMFGGAPMLQISAATSPGNSGGPVVDRSGNVLGVVTMKDSAPGVEGLSFAIPMFRACAVLAAC